MRIIAGSKRRLPLKTVSGREVRPTSDRIKETLFNMIQDEIYGRYVLDLFAGSGQIGLEAVSRGMPFLWTIPKRRRSAFWKISVLQNRKMSAGCFAWTYARQFLP